MTSRPHLLVHVLRRGETFVRAMVPDEFVSYGDPANPNLIEPFMRHDDDGSIMLMRWGVPPWLTEFDRAVLSNAVGRVLDEWFAEPVATCAAPAEDVDPVAFLAGVEALAVAHDCIERNVIHELLAVMAIHHAAGVRAA